MNVRSDEHEDSSGPKSSLVYSRDSGRVESVLAALANFFCRRWYLVVAIWLPAAAVSMVGYSKQKPLWGDEIIFRWIATLPTVRDIWCALTSGLNTDPPMGQLIAHGLVEIFGASPLVVRLMSICGICVMLLSLFLTLRNHVGPIYALIGLAIPFSTTLIYYGFEARPYGLLYGFLGIAIYCWDRVGEEQSSPLWWNVALGASLAAALGCHFYAVFALPAFYLGEGVRSLRRRNLALPTVGAMIVASSTVFLYWPIIVGARKYSSAYFSRPEFDSIPRFAEHNLQHLGFSLCALLFLAAVFVTGGLKLTPEGGKIEDSRFRELTALALGFLSVPMVAWVAGILVLKAFTDRYVLHGLFGVFLLIPLFAARLLRSSRVGALALLLAGGIPALMFVTGGIVRNFKSPDQTIAAEGGSARPLDLALLEEEIPKLSGDIVVSDLQVFLQMVNYSPVLKARCIYLWDSEKETRYTGHDGISHWTKDAIKMGWLRAKQWDGYRDHNGKFLFLTRLDEAPESSGWLAAYLHTVSRYGQVVSTVGQYKIVEAKPAGSGIDP